MPIRPYRPADRETLKAITTEAFDGVSIDRNIEVSFGPVAGRDWRWRKARQIDEDIDALDAVVWVAEDDNGQVLGYITTRFDRQSGIGSIPNLAVRSGLRGQGLGRQLIEHALAQFRLAGLQLARIETLAQNPIGQHLYPACGFVEVARQVHFALRLDPATDERD
jgi:ribosomal protein S18 acetylase RimI-like enzyme